MMKKYAPFFYFAACFFLMNSCAKPFDAPPANDTLTLNANTTIRQLKLLHVKNNFERITDDLIVSGIVIANDQSGNWYKQIIIQDETGGITVRMDGNNLFNNYPVGRKIAVKAKGLYLGDYGGVIQLGAGIDNSDPNNPSLIPLPTSLFDKYVLKGSLNNQVIPRLVNINTLSANLQDTLQSTLIQLADVEFAVNELDKTYADAVGKQAANLTIKNCSGNSIILRTSGYADFASNKIPAGNGNLVAVFAIFGTTKQLLIRDTSDVHFQNARCGNSTVSKISIAAVRNSYKGTAYTYQEDKFINGIVISDATAGNIPENEVILQEDSNMPGILLQLNTGHGFKMGDSVTVQLNQAMLTKENNILLLKNMDTTAITKIAGSKKIIPRMVTIQQLQDNITDWESTLIQLNYPAISGTFWNNAVRLSDPSGSIDLFTYSTANFYNTPVPTQAVNKLTAIVSLHQTGAVIMLRNLNDVELLSGGSGNLNNVIQLNQSPLLINFDDIANGLPNGCSVYTNAGSNSLGNVTNFATSKTSWGNTTGGFKNCASAIGLSSNATTIQQDNATNRALALRQTGTGGYDPGAAFVLHLANTTGKKNIQISFQLQSLDVSSTRTTNWTVEYGLGDNPTTFSSITATGLLQSGNSQFGSGTVQINFGSLLNNIPTEIWIRIVAKSTTSGTGSRPVTAIDDLSFTWE